VFGVEATREEVGERGIIRIGFMIMQCGEVGKGGFGEFPG